MVDSTIEDGERIATLLEAEIEGFADPPFDGMTVERTGTGSEPDDPLYTVSHEGSTLFEVVVQPDRIYLEFRAQQADVAERAADLDLRVRPKATSPPATLVFVERGADVKRVIDVLRGCLSGQ